MSKDAKLGSVTLLALVILTIIILKGCVTVYHAKDNGRIETNDDSNEGLSVPIDVDSKHTKIKGSTIIITDSITLDTIKRDG